MRAMFGPAKQAEEPAPGKLLVSSSQSAQIVASVLQPTPDLYRAEWHDGNKYPGGFGPNVELITDYWSLRAKSAELYERNLYGRGIIRRFVTNVVNTGLGLECTPAESVLGMAEESLSDWSDEVESRFETWANEPDLCDFARQRTFGALQREAYRTALISGDVLVVLRPDDETGLPRIQLVSGSVVSTPWTVPLPNAERIVHGVETDTSGRPVAYWVEQRDTVLGLPIHKRIAAYGPDGRRIAWLVFATDKRHEQVRGQPLLALLLQSLKELDRYRDAAIRKAIVNSFLALYVTKEGDGPGTRPMTGGAVRAGVVRGNTGEGPGPVQFNSQQMIPGYIVDRLAPGERIEAHPSAGTDEKFSGFEEAMVAAFSWALEVPPEIMRLSFSSNYSASQAALNELRMFLEPARVLWGSEFCQPIFKDWLIGEAIVGSVDAPGLLDAWRADDTAGRYAVAAWTRAEWSGHVKPTTDPLKMAKGLDLMLALGLTNFTRAARETTGTKFRNNLRRQRREREMAEEAGITLGTTIGSTAEPPPIDGDTVPE